MKKKRLIEIIIFIVTFYCILTLLLFVVESLPKASTSKIDSLGDAAWYLLSTLTTVGYGDVTPVTMPGKIIGAVIMISSAGVLTFLIGLLFTVLFGRLLPNFSLWWFRKKEWYIFSTLDECALTMAEGLSKDAPNAVYVFCSKEKVSQELFPSMKHHIVIDDPIDVVVKRQKPLKNCYVFLVSTDKWENYDKGKRILEKVKRDKLKVYCEADFLPDHNPANLFMFNKADNIARCYWTTYPIEKDEKKIILIGDGQVAEKILERGLLINVFPLGRTIEYHTFGDWEKFAKNHYELEKAVVINEKSENEDSIFYENGMWNSYSELILQADRIIICGSDHDENLSRMAELRQYFPVKAQIDVMAGITDDRCRSFGGDASIFTREIIMHEKLNEIAIRMNELYRSKNGSGVSWNELSEFKRQSNIAAADHILTKVRILLQENTTLSDSTQIYKKAYEAYCRLSDGQKDMMRWLEHKRWIRFHIVNNWQYSPERNDEMRRHHLLVPYEQLTQEVKILDDSAWELLGEIY